MSLFQKLHEEGATIVMVTHEMDIALHGNRIIHLRDGKIHGDEKVKNRSRAEELISSLADLFDSGPGRSDGSSRRRTEHGR